MNPNPDLIIEYTFTNYITRTRTKMVVENKISLPYRVKSRSHHRDTTQLNYRPRNVGTRPNSWSSVLVLLAPTGEYD